MSTVSVVAFALLLSLGLLVKDSQCRWGEDTKKEWPVAFCRSSDDCGDGCCKGFICVRYLKEGEKCLLEDHLNIGCGCEEGLKCKKQSLPWKHTCETLHQEMSDDIQGNQFDDSERLILPVAQPNDDFEKP